MNKLVILSSLVLCLSASATIIKSSGQPAAGARCEGSLNEAGIPLADLQELLSKKVRISTALDDLELAIHNNKSPDQIQLNQMLNVFYSMVVQIQSAVNRTPEAPSVTRGLFADLRARVLNLESELKLLMPPESVDQRPVERNRKDTRINEEWNRLVRKSRLPSILRL